MHVVMVYPKTGPDLDGATLLQMLSVLFSQLDATKKETILHEKFNFSKSDTREEAFRHMCNLSFNISEEAMKKGIKQGIEQGREQGKRLANLSMVRNLLANGVPSDVIRNSLPDLSDSEFADLLKEAKETANETPKKSSDAKKVLRRKTGGFFVVIIFDGFKRRQNGRRLLRQSVQQTQKFAYTLFLEDCPQH